MATSTNTLPIKIYEKTYHLPVLSGANFGKLQQQIQLRQQIIKEGKRPSYNLFGLLEKKQDVSLDERYTELKNLVTDYDALINLLSTNKDAYLEFFALLTDELRDIVIQQCQELDQYEKECQKLQLEAEKENDDGVLETCRAQQKQIFKSVFLLGRGSVLMLKKIQLISEGIKKLTDDQNAQRQVLESITKSLERHQRAFELQKKIDQAQQKAAKVADMAVNFENYISPYLGPFQGLIDRVTEIDEELVGTVTEIQGLVKNIVEDQMGVIGSTGEGELSEIVEFLVQSSDKQERLTQAITKANAVNSLARLEDLEVPSECIDSETLYSALESIQVRFSKELNSFSNELDVPSLETISNTKQKTTSEKPKTPSNVSKGVKPKPEKSRVKSSFPASTTKKDGTPKKRLNFGKNLK